MASHHTGDVTDLVPFDERLPIRLRHLSYRLMMAYDERDQPLYRYVLPPVVAIPAGRFLMGSHQRDTQAKRGERPFHTVHLDTYAIALHPLTILEYRVYLASTQTSDTAIDERVQRLHRIPSLERSSPDPHQYLDFPAEGLTWYEARDYAAWLAQVTGEPWRMPTEAEWEKAARGPDGRLYPWGNTWERDKANTSDSGTGETTPLGSYSEGRSPYGVYDMAGNVFEWTNSVSLPYPYHEPTGDESRKKKPVVRGGAASVHPLHARAAARNKAWPAQGLSNQGMRLVRAPNNTFLGTSAP